MKILIIGGGFAGLRLARKLNNKAGIEITLLDRYNFHQFQPLFYQVATAALDPSNISFPLRKVFHDSRNVRLRLGEALEIVAAENKVITDFGELSYDALVVATGADTNFFGNVQLKENAFPMKSTVEAVQLKHRLIQNFEDALLVKNEAQLQQLLTIVVVGGGPTGVEMSGSIAEMKKYVLPKDYPEIDFNKMKIILLEGSERVLAAMSEKSSQQARKYLTHLGVEVRAKTIVKEYDGDIITLADGATIPARMVIWAAGIKGNTPAGIKPEMIARGNRVRTDRHNKIQGFDNIYAVGDIAYMETPKYPNGHPQVAAAAIQQADTLAGNFRSMVKKGDASELKDFEYKDKGSLATVGRNLAVVDIPKPKMHIGGLLAWLFWMGLHLFLILGVKNRLFVFLNWIYSYFTYDQSLRLIFKEFYREPKKPLKLAAEKKEERALPVN